MKNVSSSGMILKSYWLFILFLLFHTSHTLEFEDFFENGAVDDTDNDEDRQGVHIPYEFKDFAKSSREHEADLEVILNPGPMIAPDIIIRQFVDSKVNVDKMMQEAGLLSTQYNVSKTYENEDSEDELPLSDAIDDSNPILNEIPDENTLANYDNHPPNELKIFNGQGPCRMKLSGLAGNFSLNFTQDCIILLTTPEKRSRIVLNCSPVALANCSIDRDTLTVNLKGDIKFGRNSYVYCGPNAQVRISSIRRRMSIKIKQANNNNEVSECSFHSRKQRDLNTDFMVSSGVSETPGCGRLGRSSKIVGGRRVSPGLFPWVAQLDITRTDGTQTACTGSLVSPEYVLTAAHCLKNAESISVFMGGTDRHEFTGSEITVQAEKYILHRKWSSRTLTADIALIKLTDSVKYTDDVSPICLPSGKLTQEDFNGRKGVAVGWGRVDSKKKAPRQLYRVRLPFLSEQRCKSIYRRFFIPKIMVCTDSTVDAAICYGDSGGPLMYKRKDKVYQIGIASFSLSKTCGASPDVFTHVREYVPWIESRIRADDS